eukprot:gene4322-4896_t
MFLECNTDNTAQTVLKAFIGAVHIHGLPSRVRGDMGVENVDVARFMFEHPRRGSDRGSFITGRGVHNQRFERLWVDVYSGVVYIYYCVFAHLEMEGLLHPDNSVELFVLHYVFKGRINKHLQQFSDGWNAHKLRTEKSMTPNQLWIKGLHDIEDDLNYGIDWNGPAHCADIDRDEEGVVVVPVETPFSDEQFQQLKQEIDPYTASPSFGIEVYDKALKFVRQMMQ